MKAFFLTIDALLALTVVMLLSYAVVVSSTPSSTGLLELHQLGRDFLVLNHAQGLNFDAPAFLQLTGLNSSKTSLANVSSSVVSYPPLCWQGPSTCFSLQDTVGKNLVFNVTVTP